ncbi:hypothetical protein [Clostridium uliginosum]|uniref:Lipoprotein n=1 Tax=Clostridium uliginosum TaxID=119641 RepID=A0A1I1S683_9CLOT|nr:hypothetical protein [Clostridium uliginosum]SFD40068.1 hypothetical protein SAMN05421842_14121 [Clostridium uliginosum]
MIKRLVLATVLMLSIALVGCSSNSASDLKNDNKNTVVENSNNDNDTTKKEQPKEPAVETPKANKEEKEVFSIYTEDSDTMNIKEVSNIELSKDLSLEKKLTNLSKALSEKVFDKLPIEVKSIDTIDGKKIATINIDESEANKNATSNADLKKPNWAASKFQGSTGGEITENSLIETLLQVKYKGEWIDGIKFLYKNEPIEFEHTPNLSGIKYRR